jgi:ribosomal protein S19E (S16A)
MVIFNEDELMHYGVLRRSGRYPWGSGGEPYQDHQGFLAGVKDLKKQGLTEGTIAKGMGMKVSDLRAYESIAVNLGRADKISTVQRLRDSGNSPTAISKRTGIPEPTVRLYLKPGAALKEDSITKTANMLKQEVADKTLVDVGHGVENYLGVSRERKMSAITMLKAEGYELHYIPIPNLGTTKGEKTTQMVLAPPGMGWNEAFAKRGEVQGPKKVSDDFGETWYGMKPPLPVNSKRLQVVYAEDGGGKYDGVIHVRPGVDDLNMNGKHYAQVRVQIDDTHFLKGMAVYKDDLPAGTDLVFHTSKRKADTPSKLDALKPLTADKDNPFGAVVDQVRDKNGKVTSAMNLVNEEGDWSSWSNTLASQVLSKQSPTLAKQQLNMTMERRLNEYDEISALTNPTVKKRLLSDFAESTDSASVHLAAASLPGQKWHVILPINTLKDNEIYAPNYNNGDVVALIRYPHGGTFEIPELKVNNKHAEAAKIIGPLSRDAVGINAKVAERLSGADFDGDTVLVIPNHHQQIQHTKALKELEGFAPRETYAKYDGMKVMSESRKQHEMGNISNLVTDMTIKNAPHNEIARAVKHSMVVIDAAKHELNYKQSAIDNGITSLKEKYQGGPTKGASTLVSLAKSEDSVPHRVLRKASEGGPVDKTTGKKVYTETGESYVNKSGKVVYRRSAVEKLSNTDDAHTLSSGTPMERIYADHSNRLKGLANQARLDAVNTPRAKQNPSAKKTYASEVASLNQKLDLAQRNAPLERQAQAIANNVLRNKKADNPNMTDEMEKKIKYQALETSRARLGAKKMAIEFTQGEWDAIQAGAISDSHLTQILNHSNMERVRELATPRTKTLMTSAKKQRAQSMLALGYTRKEVADQLGVSLTTLDNGMNDE